MLKEAANPHVSWRQTVSAPLFSEVAYPADVSASTKCKHAAWLGFFTFKAFRAAANVDGIIYCAWMIQLLMPPTHRCNKPG